MKLAAQTSSSCSEKLVQAEKAFQEGHLKDVDELLSSCLENGFEIEEATRALKLLVIVNLFIDRYEEADQMYYKLLKRNPKFEPNSLVDPSELLFLHESYSTDPKVSLRLFRVGINYSNIFVHNSYNVSNYFGNLIFSDDVNKYSNLHSGGIELSFGYEYHLNKFLSIINDIQFRNISFKREHIILNVSKLNFDENMINVDIPFILSSTFNTNKLINPYAYIGASLNYLIGSKAVNLSRTITNRLTDGENDYFNETYEEISGANIDLTEKRRQFGFSGLAGIGLKRNFGMNVFSVELRYQYSINSMNKPNQRFTKNDPMFFNFWYIDDDFKLTSWIFNVTYIKPLYNPHKRN
jgi:hypothetical protein